MKSPTRPLAAALLALLLTGCASQVSPAPTAAFGRATNSFLNLAQLPPPAIRVPVSVYDFPDQTGQFKPSENFQNLSRAVTQGAAAMLIDVLRETGQGSWFTVLERKNLDNLLKERQIIRESRGKNGAPLPPLSFAGVIFEGAIVGYDSNQNTGGLGARYLGIGGDVQYREDVVTLYMRAVSSQTGEVLCSTRTSKKIISYGLGFNIFKFVSFKKLLEFETGVTSNEPGTIALKQALELAVLGLVIDGANQGLWDFKDKAAAPRLLAEYREAQGIDPVPDASPQ